MIRLGGSFAFVKFLHSFLAVFSPAINNFTNISKKPTLIVCALFF